MRRRVSSLVGIAVAALALGAVALRAQYEDIPPVYWQQSDALGNYLSHIVDVGVGLEAALSEQTAVECDISTLCCAHDIERSTMVTLGLTHAF